MIETTTHIAESAAQTLCGLGLPPVNGAIPVDFGRRVGLTIGRVTFSCYVTGSNDTNDECVVCRALWGEKDESRAGVDSGFDDVSLGGAGM